MRRLFLPWHHHPGHPEVVVPVRVDPAGRRGPTPKAARCGQWRALGSGWFVPADVDGHLPAQRIIEAATRLGAHGAVTGWAALHWMGGRWFEGARGPGGAELLPVALAVGHDGPRDVPGLTISEEWLPPTEIVVVDGLRVTTPARSVLFEMRHARSAARAVRALDMACFSDLVSIDEVATHAELLASRTGIPQARAALALADENAWSPAEVDARLLWVRDADLAAPLANAPVFDLAGRHLVTPDLLDPAIGLVGEYDGAVHLDRATKRRDVDRDDLYRRLGLEQVVLTADDVAEPPGAVTRLHAAAARARARPAADRGWTVVPPSWWKPTTTVADRRALSEADRARLLRHRAA